MTTLTIGKLARSAGVGVDTIRFYERARLLPRPRRTASGYRLYSAGDADRLRFIRRAKALGFTLDEIGELLALSGRRDVKAVKAAAEARLEAVEHKIAELRRVRDGLRRLVATCPGHGAAENCPILAALGRGEEP
jgi:MerR family copper efflux transcriptional regulator